MHLNQEHLMAPNDYNIVDEIEKHSKDKIALWLCNFLFLIATVT